MAVAVLVLAACLLAALHIFVRNRIRYNLTHFVRTGNDISTLLPFERWTLGVVAPHLMSLELPVDLFRPPESRRGVLTAILVSEWSIRDRQALLKVIKHLQQNGHRAHCAAVTGRSEEDFLAWDLMRAVLLAWVAVNLEWISYDEFSCSVSLNGTALQAAFADWESASNSYEAGLRVWAADGKVRRVAERMSIALRSLIQSPESPWKTTDWHSPLAGTISK